jgi:hypothetical protein
MQLQIVSDVVPRCFRSIAMVRETTRVEEALLMWHSSETSQQGSIARCREGYVVLILVLISRSLPLVGTL